MLTAAPKHARREPPRTARSEGNNARPSAGEEALARAAAALAQPTGGPLALHRPAPATASTAIASIDAASAMRVGRSRDGHAEVRLDLAGGAFAGAEARLEATPRGLALTVVAPTLAAARLIESELGDLARSLEGRGIHVARAQVRVRGAQAPRSHEQPA